MKEITNESKLKKAINNNYVLCIVEGRAEEHIINTLLDNEALIFDRKVLIDKRIHRIRKSSKIEKKFLERDYGEKRITIIRIIDSRRESFNLDEIYKNSIEYDIKVLTRPEIEILYIIYLKKFDQYNKQKTSNFGKPSEFCKCVLKVNNIKRQEFIEKNYTFNMIIESVSKYSSKIDHKKEICIFDLLKDKYKKLF